MKLSVRRFTNWLASPRLAVLLLLALSVVSFLATLVPQNDMGEAKVAEWAAFNPIAERVVAVFGFHDAFRSPIFLGLAALLAASTVACSWRRTRVAVGRFRLLASLDGGEARKLLERPSFTVAVNQDSSEAALAATAAVLESVGLHAERSGALVTARSSKWAVTGSPVFHWALVTIMLVVAAGQLSRSEGLMGVPVGDSAPEAAGSFGVLDAGPLYRWSARPLTIRVDDLAPTYVVNGVERGPAPTVTVLDPSGRTVASQLVYPNRPLRFGSRLIHASDYGLAASFAVDSAEGKELARSSALIDFSEAATSSTAPGEFGLTDASGVERVRGSVSVPLGTSGGQVVRALPRNPQAVFALVSADGNPVGAARLRVGERMPLPDGSSLRLLGIGYYARLSVVDDWSVSVLYGLFGVALAGLCIAILMRQVLVVAGVRPTDVGSEIVVRCVDWRGGRSVAEETERRLRGVSREDANRGGESRDD